MKDTIAIKESNISNMTTDVEAMTAQIATMQSTVSDAFFICSVSTVYLAEKSVCIFVSMRGMVSLTCMSKLYRCVFQ